MGWLIRHYCSCGSGREVGACGHDRNKGKQTNKATFKTKQLRNGKPVDAKVSKRAERKALRDSGYHGIRAQ